MGLNIYYSNSEEFLMGIATGVDVTGDTSMEIPNASPIKSDDDLYEWMLSIVDKDSQCDTERYYDGAALNRLIIKPDTLELSPIEQLQSGLREALFNWSSKESVDWSEAKNIVQQLKSLSGRDQGKLTSSIGIIDYVNHFDKWDSGEVAQWPMILLKEIKVNL